VNEDNCLKEQLWSSYSYDLNLESGLFHEFSILFCGVWLDKWIIYVNNLPVNFISNCFLTNRQTIRKREIFRGHVTIQTFLHFLRLEELTYKKSKERKLCDQGFGHITSGWLHDTHTHISLHTEVHIAMKLSRPSITRRTLKNMHFRNANVI